MKIIACCLWILCSVLVVSGQSIRSVRSSPKDIALEKATIVFDANDDSLIHITAALLQKDMHAVTGNSIELITQIKTHKVIILIGTLDHSSFIDQLIRKKKLDVSGIVGKWDGYLLKTIKSPFKGIEQALVIAGSNKRGAAFGALELSKQMGVSPWYWWADVPVKKKQSLYIQSNLSVVDTPAVKYRGIFLNDEAPALSNWSREKFGGFNHLFYEKVFELLLRLKANYLWPAMWDNAFNDDDKLNPIQADKWGIVMGTSHHEPMLRAQQEWKRFGKGAWDYTKNDTVLRSFWRKGIENIGAHESIVTIGMRGDGDEPMTRETATNLLERIVKDQREILSEVTKKPAFETPQLWALYKEVQDYYDKGMRVPDDVTLLLCDDNWGNIRKLPNFNEPKRYGGYGIYYHFDYVGGPRNYKWINTNNLARIWEQMHLAYEYGATKIWIVNVGDLKPMELPISFFLDYAWSPDNWNEDNIQNYYTYWASQQFEKKYGATIGSLLSRYAQYASRRKPEMLDANTYSITNYNEAQRVVQGWLQLEQESKAIKVKLPQKDQDAYFQLVDHPIQAFGNLHELYYAVAWNHLLTSLKNNAANEWAIKAKNAYERDSLLSIQYHQLVKGKWNHMMDQTHIGYTYWQQPEINKIPELYYVTDAENNLTAPHTLLSKLNMKNAWSGNYTFFENDKSIAIQAEHWTKAYNTKAIKWKKIYGIGRDGSGITTFPVTASVNLTSVSPHVSYEFYTKTSGDAAINLFFSPTLNFHDNESLQYAVSIDDEVPQVFVLNKDDNKVQTWEKWVGNNVIINSAKRNFLKAGKHKLSYWMISPAVILQKIIIDLGGLKPSYLGPQETNK